MHIFLIRSRPWQHIDEEVLQGKRGGERCFVLHCSLSSQALPLPKSWTILWSSCG